jgi:hypothetical protein
MNRFLNLIAILLSMTLITPVAHSFCGFYVAKADAKLFNKASQVVLVRQDDKTVLTMANDFKGDPKEFAIVIPVPTFIEKGQIHIGDKKLIDHLDAYTSPRLVEYFDENPCRAVLYDAMPAVGSAREESRAPQRAKKDGHGVTIEAEYTIGEYDILILSAKESDGLETWLKENDYRIPDGATEVLGSYIKQKVRFFVAKVNLTEHAKLGFSYLRPIQVAYQTPKFMLPIRLGTVNADGPQELFIYAITPKGRIETTNYRTIKLPSDMELPVYIKNEFADFYRAMFGQQVQAENMKAVFLEYAWDMNWCDPCAADPLSPKELRDLGVFWLDRPGNNPNNFGGQPLNAFVTRLHLRYNAEKFPQDLIFQETADRSNFQGRYILRHPWTGTDECPAADEYRNNLRQRQIQEAQRLASLTGWNINQIHDKMDISPVNRENQRGDKNWWQKIWKE